MRTTKNMIVSRSNQKSAIQRILRWYRRYGRKLPWRETRDPYRILVSEVMLQQTQVERVIPIYQSFLRRFSTVKKLAEAPVGEVVRAWKGLGYNRRALYLKRAAQEVLCDYRKQFPDSYDDLIRLPGIGPYTARAVLSFSFHEPVALLDTNHRKLYQAFFGAETIDARLLKKADHLVQWIAKRYGKDIAAEWNQAIMDWVSAGKLFPQQKSIKKGLNTPFKKTNRYVRGRIVDLLRDQNAISQKTLEHLLEDVERARIIQALRGLLKDGLIERSKGRILLGGHL